jgi:peptidoglycan hydrolase-like amidase
VKELLIAIGVFGLFHPTQLVLRPVRGHVLVLNDREALEGGQPLTITAGDLPFHAAGRGGTAEFLLAVPGKIERRFRGGLEVRTNGKELIALVTMDLETAVASAVAAEIPPGAPLEALKAQAVVARSFYTAARGRHPGTGFDFCDTTHCQFLRHPPAAGDPAARAASETRGLLLRYRGDVLPALYSANCGGHTRALDPAPETGYPYFVVDCPLKGPRRGHALGLCQEGGMALARTGAQFKEILMHYYPNTRVE